MNKSNRREFLKQAALGGIALVGTKFMPRAFGEDEKPKYVTTIAVVDGDDPAKMTLAALELLGGIKKFVKKDQIVAVKPNIAWERPPEFAADTNPEVVAAIVKECLKAGAKKVKVFDRPCMDARKCYEISGIKAAAEKAGAEVILIENRDAFYQEVEFPKAKELKKWPVVKEILGCDCFINVPVVKDHGSTRLSLGLKNLMGLMGGNRGKIHQNIHQKIADFATVIKPQLTIADAYRVMVRRGPNAGTEKDIVMVKKIIAGTDPVAVDSYCCTLDPFKLKGDNIDYIKFANELGLGEIDLKKVEILTKKIEKE
ncbi:MAG: DUF362 domain-containing protein [Candidatus Brocadiia bacterium]